MSTEMRDHRDAMPNDTVLLLNRATVVMHAVRAVAHELNNVLQTIAGSAELLEDAAAEMPVVKRRVDAILRQTTKGRELIDGIGALARPEGQAPLPVDLVAAIERAIALRRFEHARSALSIDVDPGAGTALVRVSPRDLEVLLLNGLINAEQAVAGRPGASIRVTLTPGGARHEVAIRSNAPAPADQDLFAPFATTGSRRTSAGLGLTATRLLAAQYGGEVELRTGPDHTELVFRLPALGPASDE
jgi:signal transduction histidine kinase